MIGGVLWSFLPPTMSSTFVMSRAYLQGLPEKARQQKVNEEINRHYMQVINTVQEAALMGKTSYLYEPKNNPAPAFLSTPSIPTEDLVKAFKVKFPDCKITYTEDWVLQEQWPLLEKTKVLKTGILIDWS